ncbi:MAG: cupredoxin domain-containing protein [bacterium]|nr:cupredoxin domain-containing protein [bacterium]
MNNKIIAVIVIIILVAGALLLFGDKIGAPTGLELNNNSTTETGGSDADGAAGGAAGIEETSIKEFVVDASSFKFSPANITVDNGDTVQITVKNIGGVHDLKIDEFNAATRTLNSGEEQTITFVADKTGTFEYYCSIGSHRAMGMVGTLVVN